jgi:hypothetical protein
MELQEIEIQVDHEGNVTLHVLGVRGEDCITITKCIEEALGDLTDRTYTGEFYQERRTVSDNEQVKRR